MSSSKCQIKLESINAWSENYRLTKVEPVKGTNGRYKATITDLQKSTNYKDQFVFTIMDKDMARIQSQPVEVYFSGTNLFSVSFMRKDNPDAVLQDVQVSVKGNNVQVSSPFITKPELKAIIESNAEKILVNGVEQENSITINDFSSPITYKVVSALGKEEEYTISVLYSGLPVLIINTPNQATIPSKYEDWLENATITLLNPDGSKDYTGTTSIRGRGNSTWNYP